MKCHSKAGILGLLARWKPAARNRHDPRSLLTQFYPLRRVRQPLVTPETTAVQFQIDGCPKRDYHLPETLS